MNALSLFFVPTGQWWTFAVALSAVLCGGAALWLHYRGQSGKNTAPAPVYQARIAIIFVAFAILWWLFGFAVALWPLKGLDDFSQWARASSFVTVPLWIGGVAWGAALLVARFMRTAQASRG